MTKEERNKVKELIIKYCGCDSNINKNQLSIKIIRELNLSFEHKEAVRHRITKYLNKVNKNISTSSNNSTTEDLYETVNHTEKKLWKVEKSNYVINTKKDELLFPVELIDQMFYYYSEHGLNYSQTEMINHFNLEVTEWNSIKNHFNLCKLSNIFSPYTLEQSENPKELIKDKMTQHLSNLGKVVQKEYSEGLQREYKKTIKKNITKQIMTNTIITELNDLIVERKPLVVFKNINSNTEKTDLHLNVILTDLHIGASVEGLVNTRDYNTEILNNYLESILREIVDINPKSVDLWFLGDLIESFTGLNHSNSWYQIEQGKVGAKVILEAQNIISSFIFSLMNNGITITELFFTEGNHDRITASKEDSSRVGCVNIISHNVANTTKLPTHYDPYVVSKEYNDYCIIGSHGDLRLSKDFHKMVSLYGNSSKYNLVIKGHLHTCKVNHDSSIGRDMNCLSLFTGNNYSEGEGYTSTPGYTLTHWKKGLKTKIINL